MSWSFNRTNFERNIAVVVGINDYKNSIHTLATPVNDATVLANLLETEYEYREIIRLFPPHCEATLENLNKLLVETLPQTIQSTEADAVRLLFYFAGHGVAGNSKDGPAGYLIPQDAELVKPETFLPMRKLNEALCALNCHHLLVILDCCFAGCFRWSSTRKLIPVPETIHREHYDRFIRYPAWQVITSAAYNQEAIDWLLTDERGTDKDSLHSPFAKALLVALRDKKADFTGDKVITATELYLYLRDSLTDKDGCSEFQTPGIWPLQQHDRGEYIFTRAGFEPSQLKSAPLLDEKNNPYRGLKPFNERHSLWFFGRKQLVEELCDRVSNCKQQLTIVLGASGCGKSSLVKAGLIPHLRQQAQQWYILDPMRPGEFPLTALGRAILPLANLTLIEQLADVKFLDEIFLSKAGHRHNEMQLQAERPAKLAECWESATNEEKLLLVIDYFTELAAMCQKPEERQQLLSLHETILACLKALIKNLQQDQQHLINVVAAWSLAHPGVKLLLVIDQFEELITLSRHDNRRDDRQHLLAILAATISADPPQLDIVVTLRSDFEPRFLDSVLKPHWEKEHARFPVRAMNSDELRQAIEGPALKQALYFEPPELVSTLIDEVGQMPGALPLLSFTLSELYIKLHYNWVMQEATDRALRQEYYKELGGVAGSLTRRATQEYDNLVRDFGKELGKTYQATMERVMLRMVAIEGGASARRRVLMSELNYANEAENTHRDEVIDRLVKARLIMKGQEKGEVYVEPAHDFLVRGWNKLQEWIKLEQANLALQQRLTPAANDWDNNHQETEYLWIRDPRLAMLEKVLESKTDNWLNQLETEFVESSKHRRQDELEETKKHLQISEQRRVNAELREKAARTLNLLRVEPRESLELAIQTVGENLENLAEPLLPPVQTSLQSVMENAQVPNKLDWHTDFVSSVAISADGQTIVSGSADKKVCLWDRSGNLLGCWGHTEPVNAVAISADGQTIVSGSGVMSERILRSILSIFMWNYGSIITDNMVRLWDRSGNCIGELRGHTEPVTAVAISADGQIIVSGSTDNCVRLWDRSGNCVGEFQGHTEPVTAVAISADGQIIVSGSTDNSLRLWDRSGNCVGEFQGHTEPVTAVAIAADGETIVSGSVDNTVRLWDRHGNCVGELRGHTESVNAVAIAADGQTIVSGSGGNVTNVENGTPRNRDKSVRLWYRQGSFLAAFQGHRDSVNAVAISNDGQTIVSGSADNTVRVWDQEGKQLAFQGHKDSVNAVAISNDGQTIVSGSGMPLGGSGDNTVRLWNQEGNQEKSQWTVAPVFAVAISTDGQTIVSGGADNTVRLWDLKSNSLGVFWGHTCSVRAVAISADGQTIVSGSADKTVRLWNRQGNALGEFREHTDTVNAVAISNDGQTIVSGSEDRTIRLWDRSGKALGEEFLGHTASVTAVAISNNGQTMVSGSEDNTVRLWDLQGNSLGEFRGHTDYVWAVAISNDGQKIVSGSRDGTIRVWQAGWRAWLKVCCDRLAYHLISENPEIDITQGACATCVVHCWGGADLMKIFIRQGKVETKAQQLTTSSLVEKAKKLVQQAKVKEA